MCCTTRSEDSRSGTLNLNCITVSGKTLGENIGGASVKDGDVIRPLSNPYSEKGGLAVLCGNLAPNGSVLKTGAVHPKMHQFRGPAVIFESEESGVVLTQILIERRSVKAAIPMLLEDVFTWERVEPLD